MRVCSFVELDGRAQHLGIGECVQKASKLASDKLDGLKVFAQSLHSMQKIYLSWKLSEEAH